MDYHSKYLKYKNKYLKNKYLKNIGGSRRPGPRKVIQEPINQMHTIIELVNEINFIDLNILNFNFDFDLNDSRFLENENNLNNILKSSKQILEISNNQSNSDYLTNLDFIIRNENHLRDLSKLILNDVKGTIESVQNLRNLTHLIIMGRPTAVISPGIRGNINCLGNLTNLTTLNLKNCRDIEGNISFLQRCTNLIHLNLKNTKVDGSISDLRGCQELVYLDLEDTEVDGNIQSLISLNKLRYLNLINTEVFFQIKNLNYNTKNEFLFNIAEILPRVRIEDIKI